MLERQQEETILMTQTSDPVTNVAPNTEDHDQAQPEPPPVTMLATAANSLLVP